MNPSSKEIETNKILSSINTYEEYEVHRENIEVFESVALKIIEKHQLGNSEMVIFSEGTNIVFSFGGHKVIKIFPPFHLDQFRSEVLVLKYLEQKLHTRTPQIECQGEIDGWPYIVMDQLEGVLLQSLWETMDHDNKMVIMRELGSLIREVHSLPTNGLEEIDSHWEDFIPHQISQCVAHHETSHLSKTLSDQIPSYIESIKESLITINKPVLLTGEYTPMNFLVKQVDGVWHIDGLIDFGDAMLGLAEYDLLGPGAFLIQGDKQLLSAFLTSYGYSPQTMTENLSHQLTALMLLHKYSNLEAQIKIPDWKKQVKTLKDLENLVWGF